VIRFIVIKPALAFLLAVSVVFSPLAPVFASPVGSDGTQAVHLTHADHPDMNELAPTGQHPPKSCTTHDACTDQCCACCVHYVGALSFIHPIQIHFRPVQTPILSRLQSFLLIASHDRPPRSFSL